MMPDNIRILGTRIDVLTKNQAANFIVDRASDKSQPACYVVKPYVEFLDKAYGNPTLTKLMNEAWLSLPEAVSVQWASAYLDGRPGAIRALLLAASIIFKPSAIRKVVPEKFGGTNFAIEMLEAAEQRRLKVYLIGSPVNSDISSTARTVSARWPGLKVAGMWPGRLENKTGENLRRALAAGPVEQTLVADLRQKNPDLILVGIGFPLQIELMAKIAPQLSHGVLVGEGGTFDYDVFGGGLKKAPSAVQSLGLEWLWRLLLEPKRIGRQTAIPRFMWRVYRSGKRLN